mmetsp:Transcript_22294/g.49014  ORF Transcript_22294/g.49014 Transcript_22294/m.49014 type:complete len:211 (-) Transcript_22294:873-1505(-)
MGSPSILITTSPGKSTPREEAPVSTREIRTPVCSPSRILRLRRSTGLCSNCKWTPRDGRRGLPRATPSRKWCTNGTGTMWPWFSTWDPAYPWKAMPISSPVTVLTTGPPLLPELTAASTVTARARVCECEYVCTSTRLTTPSVMDTSSPPTGNPSTCTLSRREGSVPGLASDIGVTSSKELSSSMAMSARSHSWSTAQTRPIWRSGLSLS